MGLLALMLLHESRRQTRVDAAGKLVLLEFQDRTQWDRELIEEGSTLVKRALSYRRLGPYTLQATIAAVHANAARPEELIGRRSSSLQYLAATATIASD